MLRPVLSSHWRFQDSNSCGQACGTCALPCAILPALNLRSLVLALFLRTCGLDQSGFISKDGTQLLEGSQIRIPMRKEQGGKWKAFSRSRDSEWCKWATPLVSQRPGKMTLTMSPLGWGTGKAFLTLLLILNTKQKPSYRKQNVIGQMRGLIFDNCNPSALKAEAEGFPQVQN